MGTTNVSKKADEPAGLGDSLFTGTQQRVLTLLFGQPNRSFYAKEVIRLAGAGSGAVQRELARLSQSGLISARTVGNQKHYQANRASPIFAELCSITTKTFGLVEPLRATLAGLSSRITTAFLYGSIAKRQDTAVSDIDLMVIADNLPYADLMTTLDAASSAVGRQINPTILSRREFSDRVKARKPFVTRLLAQRKIWLIGDERDLPT